MKLVKPHAQIMLFNNMLNTFSVDANRYPFTHEEILEHIYQQIEIAGRTCVCYHSNDHISPSTGKLFVEKVINEKQYEILEAGTVYLEITEDDNCDVDTYIYNFPQTVVEYHDDVHPHVYAITTNYRIMFEHDRLDDLKYLCYPTKWHEKRIPVKITCDCNVLPDLLSHREFSFVHDFSGDCNYESKFNSNDITYVIPIYCKQILLQYEKINDILLSDSDIDNFTGNDKNFLKNIQSYESYYQNLISDGWRHQEVQSLLPTALKRDVVMVGFLSDWIDKFLPFGISMSVQQQTRWLSFMIYEQFKKSNYIK